MSYELNKITYMTPDEFADLIVGILYESKYFTEGEKYHPEDIFIAMEQIGQAIAMSMDQLQRKIVRKSPEFNAMMKPTDLQKDNSNNYKLILLVVEENYSNLFLFPCLR